jgi:hypothetical protein
MRTLPPGYIANFDSAAAMLRATARVLAGKDFPALGLPLARPLKGVVPAVNLLPTAARDVVYAVGGVGEALGPGSIGKVRAERIAQWAVDLYPRRRYPAIFLGSSNGALVHLCAALGTPWLPQTVLVPVRQIDVHPDEPKDGLEAGREPGRILLENNPELQLHHMHDPNQDRLMLDLMTYFRVKWRRLSPSYARFIEDSLQPGGTIVLVDASAAGRPPASASATCSSSARWAGSPLMSSITAARGSRTTWRAMARTAASGTRRRPTATARRRSGASSRRCARTWSGWRRAAASRSRG